MNKNQYMAAAVVAIVGLSVLGSGAFVVRASENSQDVFVQKLAQKLGIEQSKVQSAMDSLRNEHQSEMKKMMTDKLTQAVKDGKITEAQKNLILKKHEEMQSQREKNKLGMQNKTPEERKAAMDKKKNRTRSMGKRKWN